MGFIIFVILAALAVFGLLGAILPLLLQSMRQVKWAAIAVVFAVPFLLWGYIHDGDPGDTYGRIMLLVPAAFASLAARAISIANSPDPDAPRIFSGVQFVVFVVLYLGFGFAALVLTFSPIGQAVSKAQSESRSKHNEVRKQEYRDMWAPSEACLARPIKILLGTEQAAIRDSRFLLMVPVHKVNHRRRIALSDDVDRGKLCGATDDGVELIELKHLSLQFGNRDGNRKLGDLCHDGDEVPIVAAACLGRREDWSGLLPERVYLSGEPERRSDVSSNRTRVEVVHSMEEGVSAYCDVFEEKGYCIARFQLTDTARVGYTYYARAGDEADALELRTGQVRQLLDEMGLSSLGSETP